MNTQKTFNLRKVLESRADIVHDEYHIFNADTKNVFFGTHLVDWLLANHNPSQLDRKAMIQHIQDELYSPSLAQQLIYPVDHNLGFLDSEKHTYRFVSDQFDEYKQNPHILNLHGVNTDSYKFFYELDDEPPKIQQIMQELKQVVEKIYRDYVEQDGTLVDYEALSGSSVFKDEYLPFATKLAYVDKSKIIADDDLTKAFFINVYNVFAIHIMIAHYNLKKTFEMSTTQRMDAFNSCKYNIGGHNYSLNDIHHGILRKNATGSTITFDVVKFVFSFKPKGPRFVEADPRFKFVIRNFDPRINFALNFGALSCPPIKFYDYENIENQLDHAAKRYCTKEVTIVETKGRRHIQLNQLLKDLNDYGTTNIELYEYILNHCDDDEEKEEITKAKENPDKAQVEFKKFNYDINAKKHHNAETRLASVV